MSPNESQDVQDKLAYDRILECLGGDLTLLDTLGRIFQEDYPTLISEMDDAFSSTDADALKSATHKLRGLVANFYDDQLAETLGSLEAFAAVGDLSHAPTLLHATKQRCNWLSTSLIEVLGKAESSKQGRPC